MEWFTKFMEMNSIVLSIFGSGIFLVVLRTSKSVADYFIDKGKATKAKEKDIIEIKDIVKELITDNVEMKKTLKIHKRSNVSILHDKVYKNCREYLKRGDVTVEELDNLEYLYTSYKEQGGNGTGDNLYNRVKKLPIKE